MKARWLVSLSLTLLAQVAAAAPEAPAAAFSESQGEVAMPSAFEIVTQRDPQAALVHITLMFRSGSLEDPTDLPGLAHFTARALLKGTQTRPYKDLIDAIERLGGTLEVSIDQTTTTFTGAVLAENLDFYLDVLRDVFSQPAFDVQELLTLQDIIRGELVSSLQDTREIAKRALMSLIYSGTKAERPVLGTLDGISKITPKDAAAFFQRAYVKGNLVIGVSSALEDADIQARLRSKLATIAEGPSRALPFPAWSLKGRRAVIVDRKDLATASTFVAIPGVGDADPSRRVLEAANAAFGGDFTSRLMRVLREEKGWTYGVRSGFEIALRPQAESGFFGIYTFPSAEFSTDALKTTWEELEKYARLGLTEEEWNGTRDALSRRYAFEIDTATKRLAQQMRSAKTGRPLLTPDAYTALIAATDLSSVNAQIAAHHDLGSAAIAVVGDAAVLKPLLKSLPQFDSVSIVEVQP